MMLFRIEPNASAHKRKNKRSPMHLLRQRRSFGFTYSPKYWQ